MYGYFSPDWWQRRVASDMYQLGSVAMFLFSGFSANAMLTTELAAVHHWKTPGLAYPDVLPFLRDAFGRVLAKLSETMKGGIEIQVLRTIEQMCEPDINKTLGDPSDKDFEDTYRATEGLLRYREGKIESARDCYQKSRLVMEKAGDFRRALVSIIYQSFEEESLKNFSEAARLIEVGEGYAKRFESREFTKVLEEERNKLQELAAQGQK